MASFALAMGKASVVALTSWRAATSSISRIRVGAADGAAGDGANSGDERECLQRNRRGRHTDEAQGSGGTQRLDVDVPILISVGGIQDEVERAGHFFHRFRFARMHEVMRAESAGFFFLGCRGGEGGDFCAEDAGKLNGDVPEAADPDDANA